MIKDFAALYSENARSMRRSEIRELLKITRRSDIISFAGGLPASETFPIRDLIEITCTLLEQQGAIALQYGPTEGEMALREELVKWLRRDHTVVEAANILVTSGSQQGLDIISKVFLDPNDVVLVELPSYIGALQAFTGYRANMIGVPQDDQGMRMDILEQHLAKLSRSNRKPKFIYVVPDFQNPSGVTMSLSRRKRLVALAHQYELPIVEDSPYRDLRFTGEPQPTILSLDDEQHVITLGTFSKLLCPGLRLAWVTAPLELMDRLVVVKQGMDLSSPIFTQFIVAEYMARGLLPAQVARIRELYARKRMAMLDALEAYMPEGVEWTKPEGGLFLWVKLPDTMNATALFPKAVEKKVAYVIGSAFHCNGQGQNTMRLNFSYPTVLKIDEGIKRLASMIRENL
jgi:2-aminoadipate transaminase